MLRKISLSVLLAMILLLPACGNKSDPTQTTNFGEDDPGSGTETETGVLEQLQIIDPSATLISEVTDFTPFQDKITYVQCDHEINESGMKLTGTADRNAAEPYLQNGWIEGLDIVIPDELKNYNYLQLAIYYDEGQTTSSFMELIYTTNQNQTYEQGQIVRIPFSQGNDSCIFSIPATEHTKLMLWPIVGTETILIKQIDIYAIG